MRDLNPKVAHVGWAFFFCFKCPFFPPDIIHYVSYLFKGENFK